MTAARQARPHRRLLALGCAAMLGAATPALAQDAMLGNILEDPGSGAAGLGFLSRVESSPYRGADARVDLMPLYLYEGERFFLRSNTAGVRVTGDHAAGLELFVERRLEGYPEDETPDVLEGMDTRNSEADVGARYYGELGAHHWDLSVRQDVSNNSHGTELRAAYGYLWQDDRWRVQPVLSVAWRSGDLNDYYYGVDAVDVTPDRPAYNAGAGLNLTAALYARYRILHNW
ncbi:MAG TPA: MipA/OmpV family protein, partial [Stenotrophomonas sp.]|nr:MipA/OmpV family protein [Stenotrophomonas sp.]